MTNLHFGRCLVVIGGQWGDEGKGRIVDTLAENSDVVVRFAGGNNAGHTLHIGNDQLVLHLIPCGIMRAEKICIIGNGVVIDPEVLLKEIDMLSKHGVRCDSSNLKISHHAHIIFPFHKSEDAEREARAHTPIGTTKRGIGPCYEYKIARMGITVADLLSVARMRNKFENIRNLQPSISFDIEKMIDLGRSFADRLKPFVTDTGDLLEHYLRDGKRVMFEGAQGSLLDVDHGTYPYVTSSNCVAAAAAIGSGIGPTWFDEILIVSKAYCTRVGEGPFFSEADADEQELFRSLGNEFGATTGRPRRCGWIDLPALKYAARINGATGIILTKIDILAGLNPIKIGMHYTIDGLSDHSFNNAMSAFLEQRPVKMVYKEFSMEGEMPESASSIHDLPRTMQKLIGVVEDYVGIPVRMVSYGPRRGQEFYKLPS